jgi:hypothetical protein
VCLHLCSPPLHVVGCLALEWKEACLLGGWLVWPGMGRTLLLCCGVFGLFDALRRTASLLLAAAHGE